MMDAPLTYDAENRIWRMALDRAAYMLGYRDGRVVHLGFGLPRGDADPWARVAAPRWPYWEHWAERCSEVFYRVEDDERAQDFDLIEQIVTPGDLSSLTIWLRDRRHPLEIQLGYALHRDLDMVVRSLRITNVGDAPVMLTELPTCRLRFLEAEVTLESLWGAWGDEWHHQTTSLPVGTTVLESRVGKSTAEQAPWFSLRGPAGCLFGQLAYSGNWRFTFLKDAMGGVTITCGIHPWGFRHRLAPGRSVDSPDIALGFTPGDANAVSQALQRYQRRVIIPNIERLPLVKFDSWYPNQGPTQPARMKLFIDAAQHLGCEAFVLNAGWYVNEETPENSIWWAQIGDWLPNAALFPEGIGPLADYAHDKGLKFGIWMEPESIAPTARVLHEHPEWMHSVDGHPLALSSGRRALYLGHPQAWQWAYEQVCRVVRGARVDWLMWDFNNNLYRGGDDSAGGNALLLHVQGLYRLWDAIRATFPDLILESCSSGAMRVDLGSIAHTHVSYISDMAAPTNVLGMRFGSSYAYAARAVMAWLIHWPADWDWWFERGQSPSPPGYGDLAFRIRLCMMGALGLSAAVEQWSETDFAQAAHHVQVYKALRPLICSGDQYRLTAAPPYDGNGEWAAMSFVEPHGSEAVLFAFRLARGEARSRFTVSGLIPTAQYLLTDDDRGVVGEASGQSLLAEGVEVALDQPFTSSLFRMRMVSE